MIPTNISKENILEAFSVIDAKGVKKGAQSSTYDVIFNDKRYPPKLVISIANKFANGYELDRLSFQGGEKTKAFEILRNHGFIIERKPFVKDLVHEFLEQAKTDSLKTSQYPNSYRGLKIKVSFGVGNQAKIPWIALLKPPNKVMDGIYPGLLYYKEHRLLILTYGKSETNSSSYSWNVSNKKSIKDYFQEKFNTKPVRYGASLIAEVFNVDEGIDYEKLETKLDEIIDKYKTISFEKNEIHDPSEIYNSVKYWIFQCNPSIFDLESALRANAVHSWRVGAHKDKIKPGDKAIIWVTGSDSKCLALGEILTEPSLMYENREERKYYYGDAKPVEETRIRIKITNNLLENPIHWSEIKLLPEFQDFKAGNQGTNFSATKKEYLKLLEMATSSSSIKYWIYSPGENAEFWNEFYQNGIMGLGWDYLGDLRKYSSKEDIISKMQEVEETDGSKKNDATACDDFLNHMKIGDIVIAKKGRSTLIGYGKVISDYYYDNERKTFQKLRKVDWQTKGEWNAGFNLVLKTLTDITRYPSELSQFDYYYERLLAIIEGKIEEPEKLIDKTLNTILYGPPGTGKTFKLQNKYFDEFTVKETSLNRSQYLENIISDLTWWQVLSIILLDIRKTKVNNITNHELLSIKAKLSNSRTVRPTVWGRLQAHTKLECPNVNVADRSQPAIFYKDEESYWTVDEELLEQYYPEAFSILEQVKKFKPSDDKLIKNYEFVTFHQSFSYEDFIEGIKPKLDDQESEVSYEIQDGIFKKLCLKADADRDNTYAIFIDEINRGNVSAIFGELITLIEKDKRLGEENELRAKLPYSKKDLGVPPNLYIYGTMNTADRSVEALDTALRRRFAFEEVMPIPNILQDIEFDGFDLSQVLTTINGRIEALLDRDHTIGHSYFIKINSGDTEALQLAFENKIIPLLQEYFYHDYEKIALILGEGFVKLDESNVKFAKFKNIEEPELTSSFKLKPVEDIEAAINALLNNDDEEN